jgi:sensor histidine kinase YesM
MPRLRSPRAAGPPPDGGARGATFWWLYAAAWPPLAASYVVVFLSTGAIAPGLAIASALYNVVPAALCGVAAVRVCDRVRWPPRRRAAFFAAQLGLAAGYAIAWAAAVAVVFTVASSIQHRAFTLSYLSSWALQWTLFSGLLIYGTIASACYARHIARRLRDEQLRAERLEALRARAELAALRAQLQPHFVFNTLHSVMALVRRDRAAAERAIEQLAQLLRYALRGEPAGGAGPATDDVRLEDELAFVDTYLALEALRLGDRLRIERRIDPDALDCAIPALTVQPLVENAIKHAVAPRAAGGTLTIAAGVAADGKLWIEVRDDGPGADPRAVDASRGMGLRLVRQRLETRYPGDTGFEVVTAPGAGFAVRLRGPAVALGATEVKIEPATEAQVEATAQARAG